MMMDEDDSDQDVTKNVADITRDPIELMILETAHRCLVNQLAKHTERLDGLFADQDDHGFMKKLAATTKDVMNELKTRHESGMGMKPLKPETLYYEIFQFVGAHKVQRIYQAHQPPPVQWKVAELMDPQYRDLAENAEAQNQDQKEDEERLVSMSKLRAYLETIFGKDQLNSIKYSVVREYLITALEEFGRFHRDLANFNPHLTKFW